MRNLSALFLRRTTVLAFLCFLFVQVKAQTTITTLPTTTFDGGNSLGSPASITFVLENTNSSGIFLTGVSNYCTTAENNSVWQLYYTSTALTGTSTDVTAAPWSLVATSNPTPVTASGITPIDFSGLSFFIPGNTQYRFALRNTGPGSTRYSGTGGNLTPNVFSDGGVNLQTGNFQIAGTNVGYSGTGTGLTLTPRYFTGAVTFIPATACSGTPLGGNAQSSVSGVCSPTQAFTLSVTGSTAASGLTYQWQTSPNGTTWTDITGATGSTLNVAGINTSTYYKRIIYCGVNSATSASVQVTSMAVAYTPLPYAESFENTWADVCDTRDVPNNFWRNTPVSGNTSWRRSDDPAGGSWTLPNNGLYNPNASDGSFSARFHSYEVTGRAQGSLDLYINANTATASKRLSFDYINTSGSDSVTILISTNGGTSFTRVDSVNLATAWRTKTVIFNSTSPTTIIRFLATGDFGVTDIGIDKINIIGLPACTGTPVGGTIVPSASTVCSGIPFTLTVTGSVDPTTVGGLAFQWQSSPDGTIWTDIAGATGEIYTSTGITANTQFRRQITCSGNSSTSTVANFTLSAVSYASIPFKESFEATWLSMCSTRDVPNNFWRNIPVTTDSSWRRNDDGINSGAWTNNFGPYTPDASDGSFSARFHSYQTTSTRKGRFDLYVNAATPSATKRLSFDFINTSGTDSLTVLLSTNGGATFVRLDSVKNSTVWRTKQIIFTSTSATTVIRFQATSDFGVTDIGLDNVNIIDFPNCNGTPVGGTTVTTNVSACPSTPFTLNVTGATDANGLTYQWQSSPDGITWTNISGATGASYTSTGIIASTQFRRQIICGTNSSFSTTLILAINPPSYTVLPYAESFENVWINGCGVRDIPNNFWRNTPVTSDSSWRRSDDEASALWVNPANGIYTPEASNGNYSARFHSYQASSGTKGKFDLYVNAATASATKRLSFDFINTSGSDSLVVLLSTNGGATFVRLDSVRNAAAWRTKQIIFTSTSATTVIRFQATSDFGTTDIGLDNIFLTDFADCAGVPNAGTTVSSSMAVCGDAFTLSLQGSSSAAGITYQWQSSLDGTNWTDIAGATNFTYTTSQAVSTWYRAVVTCTISSELSRSVPIRVISPTPVNGVFDINNALPTNAAAKTFNSFNDAYNFIKCGIDGPVTFNVKDNIATSFGAYNEQLIMNPVPGSSATKTVTFKGHGSTITFASNNTNERAVIKLRGADFIRFDSLIITAAGTGTYGYGVQLINSADSNIISNCTINVNNSATTTNFGGIVINATDAGITTTGLTLCDYNTFTGNTINGGYLGISLVGSAAGANGNNKFINNNIRDFYLYGLYLTNSYQTLIEGNTISRPTRSVVSTFYGVYLTGLNSSDSVSKNNITNPYGGALTSTTDFNGVYITGADPTPGNENIVSNNLIWGINGAGAQNGFYNSSSDNVWYLHNTVDLSDASSVSTSTTRGFYQTLAAGGIIFYDNMITIGRGGAGAKHGLYMATNTTAITSNYNNIFLNAPAGTNFVGFYNANQTTLADWQSVTGQDLNSISRNPFYTSPASGNFMPTNGAVDNKGAFANITTDILNAARSTTTPDIGAYEFAAAPCTQPPLSGNTQFSDTTVCQNSPVRLNLTISNWGGTQTFQWQTATAAGGPWTNFSSVMSDPDTTIMATKNLYYRVVVTCGASSATSNALLLLVSPALPSGTYTIKRGGGNTYVPGIPGGNFESFNDAKAAMSCGIFGGPVVFNVLTPTTGGTTYNEQLRLDSIPGTSVINTITFNGNGNTIIFNPANSNERAVIKLSGTDFIRFDSLTIDASGGTYGYGVQLLNNADSNIFRKCTIISNTTATTTNFAGVVINATEAGPTSTGATNTDGNLFDRNTIIGGNSGITVVGNTTAAGYINDNQFTNNTIRDFYTQGIYVAGTRNTLIQGNLITRPTRTTTASTVYGILATAVASNKLVINQNRFTKFFFGVPTTTATFYAIQHNLVDAPAGNESFVTNNLVYGIEGNGPAYGFYNIGSDNVFYYHNTISFDNASSTTTGQTAGLYQTTAATGLLFKNNIVTIRRGGTGNKHAIYMATTTGTQIEAAANDYFVQGINAYTGFRTTNQGTLALWQAASGQDANSYDLNPLYTDTANGNYRPQLLAIDNKGVPVGVTADILNSPRSLTTPDIGAYEFLAASCTTPPVAGTATVTPSSGICLETPIKLNITGHSALGSLTFQWQHSPDGINWTNLSRVQYFPEYDTVTTVNRYYRAAVTCNGNTQYTNTVQVNLNPLLLAGNYTIDPGQPISATNFQSFGGAVSAMLCGITGPVVFKVADATYNERIRIPYIPGSSTTNTVTFLGANGSASLANLTFNADATANYTLRLDSTQNFIFRDITFTAQNATNGRAVELFNRASNISFINNKIATPAVTTATTAVAGIHAATHNGSNILVKGNKISGGSYGIYLQGGTIRNLVVDSNSVSGAFQYGIYTSFAPNIQLSRNTVAVTDTVAASAYGIYVTDCDSAYRATDNVVTIGNTGVTRTVYGIYINNSDSVNATFSRFASNRVTAGTDNQSTLYGVYINNSPGTFAVNNVVSIHTTGASSYAWYLTATASARIWNNSVQSTAASATNNYAAYFNNISGAQLNIRNNIFSHKGGGRALYAASTTGSLLSDYNMLYTSGAVLAQAGTPAATYATLDAWKNGVYWDLNSIVYAPAFANTTNLRPDLANSDVWAMHGRGVQIAANNVDFSGASRPTTLTAGVPDLGAYEFFPTAQPTLLTPVPTTPAANGTQTFMFGTDTVMKITWGPTAPPSVGVRRYSGVVPSGLPSNTDSMFFYNKVEIPGGGNYNGYNTRVYYIDPWQGSVPDQNQIGLGKTTPSNTWLVGFSSRVDVAKKFIYQNGVDYLDKFTGLINPYAPPVIADKDSSNRGRRFWVAYPINELAAGTTQQMVLYLSAQEAANVQVKINGTNWVRNYFVPANTVRETEYLPKAGTDNAYISLPGVSDRGISITSDVPIVAYAHVIGSTSSGAAMLMPVGVWGYEYKTLGITQTWGTGGYSYYYVVADNDNTKVEITSAPGIALQNTGVTAGVPYVVTLNKGQVYQVIASGTTTELSGSTIRSIPNDQGKCFPIATFSGSSRTQLTNGCGSGGDFMMQQNFPSTAWGKRYLTAPSSASTDPTILEPNIYRVAVKDPTTVVKRNGVTMTGLQNNFYYQFQSNTPEYIEADKEIMVAQFLTGSCVGVGDPEMIYLSPIEQGINKIGFYRNNEQAIVANYLTLIIPTNGLSSMVITDGNTVVTPDYTYAHPSIAGYTVVVKRWTSAKQQVRVQSDSSFTAITYGLGSVESYGYNAGTLVKTLRALGSISNTLNPSGTTNEFTCAKAPFTFAAYLPLRPDSIRFGFSQVPGLSPSTDVVLNKPVPSDSVMINGVKHYVFKVTQSYTFANPGLYSVQLTYAHPSIESCDKKAQDVINVQVVPSPASNFTTTYSGCVNDVAQFTGVGTTSNGVVVNNWQWTFNNGTTATGQNASFTYTTPGTYSERLRVVTAEGCVGDTTRQITVNARPTVNVVQDSVAACAGATVSYTVQSPATGTTYNWYTTATGGTPILANNTTYSLTATTTTDFYVEAVNAAGCASTARKRVRLVILQPLAAPVVSATGATANSVTFSWPAVAGASGYEVSTTGGAPWSVPSSGASGLTHTVSGLTTLQSVTLTVRAIGTNACQASPVASASGCANSATVIANPTQSICLNTTATFTVQNPLATLTYKWFTASTGGTQVGSGASFTTPALTATTSYWVEQSNGTCTSTTRTQVTATILQPLAQPVVTVVGQEVNSVTFGWNAVPGASSYEVSVRGGAFVTPSSGSTGLTHTVTGLRPLDTVSVVVRALGAITCQAGTSATVLGRSRPTDIFIPNAFTPNGDGLNDRLLIYAYVIKDMQFMIFNQFGEKIFESRDQNTGWDGTFKGKAQPSGVYLYVARFILKDGSTVERKGSINLIR